MGNIDTEIKLDFLPPKTIYDYLYICSRWILKLIWGITGFYLLLWALLLVFTFGYYLKENNCRKKSQNIPLLAKATKISKNIHRKNNSLTFLKNISTYRSSWGAKIAAISRMVPYNMWFDNLTVVSQEYNLATISIDGKAKNNFAIITFLKKLENTEWLEKVQLNYSTKDSFNGEQINSFQILCKSRY